jgi:GNAT superfamily N-acetyltransferase
MIDIRPLADPDVALVDARLPLHRLDQHGPGLYLIAWEGDDPVGHGYVALTDPPELGDVFVSPSHRRRGIATAITRAAEAEAASRGFERLRLSYGIANDAARSVYEHAGYVDAGLPPKRVEGTIVIRGEEVAVDDTLVYLERLL